MLLQILLFALLTSTLCRTVAPRWRSVVLLAANLAFYVMAAGWYVGLMLAVGLWSFAIAARMAEARHPRRCLTLGLVPIVLSLCTLKYATPLLALCGTPPSALHLLLPLGMSYYVLKAVAYLVDVYRGRYPAERSLTRYLAWLTFFGQITAGPIQRYEQWQVRPARWSEDAEAAFYPIVRGLFMKLVIAARLAPYVTAVMADPAATPGLNLWLALVLYAVYLYADFAGYSYIAIGVTRLLGIHCPDNFRLPYFAVGIRDFWARWHISLSTWLRDYIYIPLGGNRRGPLRRIVNVLLTFLVSGVWHGSTLNFLAWGAYHGVLNALWPRTQAARCLQTLLTFVLVALGWILFATASLHDAAQYIVGMLTRTTLSVESVQWAIQPFTGDNQCVAHFLTVMLFIAALAVKEATERYAHLRPSRWRSYAWQVFLLSSLLLFGAFGRVEFVYGGF